ERRTLGGLLTLPGERWDILRAKCWGGILRFRYLVTALLALWTVGVLCGALHPVAALLLAATVAAHRALQAPRRVNLSLVSRNTFWSNFNMTLMLLVMFVGALVGSIYYQVLTGNVDTELPGWWDDLYRIGLSPVRAWWYLGFDWEQFHEEAF